jgi:hypothetical protein
VKRKRRKALPPPLPLLFAELALASWETIWRRSLMMAQGTCSGAEYRRMVAEKVRAAGLSSRHALRRGSIGSDPSGLFLPFHRAATRNAKRLRGKKPRRR